MKQKKTPSYLLPPHVSSPQHHDDNNLEFSESDIVWSPNSHSQTDDVGFGEFNFPPTPVISPPCGGGYTAGISAALLAADSQQYSPTSVQRKMMMTTSSPVSMILSSSSPYLSRNDVFGFGTGSAPVNVPVWPEKRHEVWKDDDGDEEEDEDEMVPPHEIVAKSYSKTMSFSVVEGVGRKLKGRDLTKLRNSVFVKTGFLD